MNYKQKDEKKIESREKITTLRKIDHPFKGDRWATCMSKRVKGGFGKAKYSKPYYYDMKCLNDNMAKMLGFESKEEYLAQDYNKGLENTIKKGYILEEFIPNNKEL